MITDQFVAPDIYIKNTIQWKLLKSSGIIMLSVDLSKRILNTCFEELTQTQNIFHFSLSLSKVLA